VYAWGSAEDENLDLAVQSIDGLHSAPTGVPGGTGGQAAADGPPVWLVAVTGIALAGALASAGALTRARVNARQ
jgi:hypothetical protein